MYKLQILKFIQDFELRREMLFLKKEKKMSKVTAKISLEKKKKKTTKNLTHKKHNFFFSYLLLNFFNFFFNNLIVTTNRRGFESSMSLMKIPENNNLQRPLAKNIV